MAKEVRWKKKKGGGGGGETPAELIKEEKDIRNVVSFQKERKKMFV